MSSHLQTHLTTSTFNVLCRFSGIKTRSMAGSGKVHALGSPRDTALRSVPELKQFIGKNAITFLLAFSA
ncbi:hypothetical protein [Escherichia coli]|uniref:hypothetical protein n=1 Tax=Escherichia coli TaxID=562 RepID=UPI0002E0E780|nr:hypothetical protein [Escherichia coli]